MVNDIHKLGQDFEFLDACLEVAEACASLDQMLDRTAAAVDDQKPDSLHKMCNALSSLVATISELKERFERAVQQAQLDPDNVCYIKTKFFAICSILDSNFE